MSARSELLRSCVWWLSKPVGQWVGQCLFSEAYFKISLLKPQLSYPLSYPGLKAGITVRKSRVRDHTTHLESPARNGKKINAKLARVDKTIWGISEHRLDASPTLAASNSGSSCSGLRLLVSSHQHVRPSLCFEIRPDGLSYSCHNHWSSPARLMCFKETHRAN